MDANPPTPQSGNTEPPGGGWDQYADPGALPGDKDAARKRKGVRIWCDGLEDDGTVARYLRAIGVPESHGTPLPPCLRFDPRCEDEWKGSKETGRTRSDGPAMLARFDTPSGEVAGVLRTFLEKDRPAIREKEPRKLAGICGGNAIHVREVDGDAPVVLTTQLEGALAVAASVSFAVWATVDGPRLRKLRVPAEMFKGRRGRVVIVLVGRDEEDDGNVLASRLREEYPAARVVVARPPGTIGTWLEAVRDEGKDAIAAHLGQIAKVAAERNPGARGRTGAGDGNSGDGGGPLPGSDDVGDAGERSSSGGALWWDEEHPTRAGEVVVCLSTDPVDRAKAFLLMECSPSGGGATRFDLAYWGGAWFRYVEGGYLKVDPVRLRGMVQQWLHRHWRKRELKKSVEISPIAPGERDVEAVCYALAGLCYVTADGMPAWLPAMFTGPGRVDWGGGVRAWHERKREEKAEDLLPFSNGLLDLRTLREEREVRILPHDPELFCGAARPYAIDAEALRDGLDGGFEEGELGGRVCPTWTRWLDSVCEGDNDRRVTLQRMFGDTIGPDRGMEVVYMLCGPTRSGKGVCIHALTAVCGREALASVSFSLLSSQFGMAPLVGRHVAVMPDAHLGHMTDGTAAVEMLKTISGNDPVTVRDLYTPAQGMVRLGVRFWIFVNDPPAALRDSSGAFAKRLVIWPFTKSFYGAEDFTIKRDVAAEAPGIAVWALVGYADLWKSGVPRLVSPAAASEMVEAIEENSSPLLAFVRACCDIGPEFEVDCTYLFEAYAKHLKSEGHEPVRSIKRFRTMLQAHVPGFRRAQRTIAAGETRRREGVYVGIRIKPEITSAELAVGLPH